MIFEVHMCIYNWRILWNAARCILENRLFNLCVFDAGKPPDRRGSVSKETKKIQSDKKKLTLHFIDVLPMLLEKYRVEWHKLEYLLLIVQHFDLELYTIARKEENLDSLLTEIRKIVDISHRSETLDNAAKALECLCNQRYVISVKYVQFIDVKLSFNKNTNVRLNKIIKPLL